MSDKPEEILQHPERFLSDVQRKWVRPRGWRTALLHRVLFATIAGCLRSVFRFHVAGRKLLPIDPPVIFAPNHESSLDAPLLITALPYRLLRQTFWAVREGRVLANPLTRFLGRVVQAVPVERDVSGLTAGAAVLKRKHNLVWFPEGTRSRDGDLQRFKFGVGALARHFNAPVIPVAIEGAFEAWPPDARLPRLLSSVSVRFGEPLSPAEVRAEDESESYEQIAQELRERVAELTIQARSASE